MDEMVNKMVEEKLKLKLPEIIKSISDEVINEILNNLNKKQIITPSLSLGDKNYTNPNIARGFNCDCHDDVRCSKHQDRERFWSSVSGNRVYISDTHETADYHGIQHCLCGKGGGRCIVH